MAAEKGLILVDTKYEFGKRDGKIILMDEIHTPDSSRYFYAEGYEERLETTQTQVEFSNVDTTKGYTVEVTASGMTQPTRTSITANPITLKNLNVDSSDPAKLTVTWDYSGADPKDGWLLLYSFDNAT